MSAVSTQRPNLKPTERSVPTEVKPSRRCSAIDAALPLSPMIAIICRFAAHDQRAEQGRDDTASAEAVRDINRIFDRMAVGRATVIGAGVAVSED